MRERQTFVCLIGFFSRVVYIQSKIIIHTCTYTTNPGSNSQKKNKEHDAFLRAEALFYHKDYHAMSFLSLIQT